MKFAILLALSLLSFKAFAAQDHQYACKLFDDLYKRDYELKVTLTMAKEEAQCTILIASLVLPCNRVVSKGGDGYTIISYEFDHPLTKRTSKFIINRGSEETDSIWGVRDLDPGRRRADPFHCTKLKP